ncbi:MAG: response regulator [Scytonematopsis contorta HA4267-MV1]|jgi:PAS domain S-box-containing protein|nr:response regulator [Scytonematopsis contorta HA4267-MV1]
MSYFLTDLLSERGIEHLTIAADLKILEMSPGVSRFADMPEEVKYGNDVWMAFPELVGTEEVIEEILQGKENNFEIRGVSRSQNHSSPLYIDIYMNKNINNKSYQQELMIFMVDVTERMLMERTLVQSANEANLLLRNLTASKQYTEQIVTSMADALLVTTLSGKIKKINPAAQILLEYTENELISQSISTMIKEVEHLDKNSSNHLTEVETICTTKSGKKIPIAISCSRLQTDVEHFQGYIYILRDMTERKQAELAKQEFLAMISHEIRTPITSVTGMASLLLKTDLTVEQQDYVKTIHMGGNTLLQIINDILDLSKIESRKLELEAQAFELRRPISEVFSLLAPQAKEKGLKLEFIDTPEIPQMILGDITRLRQILLNLIANAIKFTEKGSIELTLKTLKNNSNSATNNYEIEFAIKDTGIGIPPASLNRLFQSFTQVNASITREYGGTGLGLTICKQLCELMGGKIWVESEYGVGSIFYFTINVPVLQEGIRNWKLGIASRKWGAEDTEENPEVDANMAKLHPLRILLVEDNAINQRMIRLMLRLMGYEAEVASNGLEALEILRHQSYDLLLMDVQMPGMDGLTATEKIYEEWTVENRPQIIGLTASAMWGDRERCLASGMNDYLGKPIKIAELMQALKRCQPLVWSGGEEEMGRLRDEGNKGDEGDEETSHSQLPTPHSQLSTPHSPLNSTALEEIFKMAELNTGVNPAEFLLETIDDFLDETPRLLQGIHIILKESNPNEANLKKLRRLAHTLSSLSATLGANNLATISQELEMMAAKGILLLAKDKVCLIEKEFQLVDVALQQERVKYQF